MMCELQMLLYELGRHVHTNGVEKYRNQLFNAQTK